MKFFLKKLFYLFLLVPLISVLFLFPSDSNAWPTDTQWISVVRQSDWSPIRDITGDMSPYNADISSNGYYKDQTVGTWDSVAIYTDGSYIYFRFLLSGNPLSYSTSQSTWIVDSRTSYVALLDTNHDNTTDWTATVSKDNSIKLFEGMTLTQSVTFGPITQTGSIYTESGGYLRVTDTGTLLYDRPGVPSMFNLHYLDYRIPISWLTGVTSKTFIRPFYGTSNNDQNINKDYMIGNSLNFDQVSATSIDGFPRWGALYDTRDTAPSSNAGIWYGNETLMVTGFGWPSNKTLTVQIYSPDGSTLLWEGSVSTTSTGTVSPTMTWPIPLTVGPGFYRINVRYPQNGPSLLYDTFEIRAPYVTVTKTVTPTETIPGDQVTYTVTLYNSGNMSAAMTGINDTLSSGFTYVSGSTTGLTTANPVISGSNLTWSGSWSIPAGGTRTLSFKAVTPNSPGEHKNQVSAYGTNFGPYSSGPTASVFVRVPAVSISKSVDKSTAAPGEEVIYTITFKNQGGAAAQTLAIVDAIPNNTTYVIGSLRVGDAGSTYETAAYMSEDPGDDSAHFNGSSVIFTVGPVAKDDGVPGSGSDEGKCYFKVKIN